MSTLISAPAYLDAVEADLLSPALEAATERLRYVSPPEAPATEEDAPSENTPATGLHASDEILNGLLAEKRFQSKVESTRFVVSQTLKRALDVVLAGGGLIALSPMLLLIAALVKITSPEGPVLYASKRLGKDRKPFGMLKFRTMIPNADKLREQLRKETGQEGKLFKLKDDPRITPLGRFLRKYSLDEFPQLINVLRGEMSLVGPRPFSPDNCELFSWPYTLRFRLKPGITGQWQVSGRADVQEFDQVQQLELSYVLNASLRRDALILMQTVPAVLLKKGSC